MLCTRHFQRMVIRHSTIKRFSGEFSRGPEAKTSGSQYRGTVLIPGQGTKEIVLHATIRASQMALAVKNTPINAGDVKTWA